MHTYVQTISCRSDLEEDEDFQYPFGAIDSKVSSYLLTASLRQGTQYKKDSFNMNKNGMAREMSAVTVAAITANENKNNNLKMRNLKSKNKNSNSNSFLPQIWTRFGKCFYTHLLYLFLSTTILTLLYIFLFILNFIT